MDEGRKLTTGLLEEIEKSLMMVVHDFLKSIFLL